MLDDLAREPVHHKSPSCRSRGAALTRLGGWRHLVVPKNDRVILPILRAIETNRRASTGRLSSQARGLRDLPRYFNHACESTSLTVNATSDPCRNQSCPASRPSGTAQSADQPAHKRPTSSTWVVSRARHGHRPAVPSRHCETKASVFHRQLRSDRDRACGLGEPNRPERECN